ncbi:hypothetical protein [Methylocaldum sp.]|uniref:hypothetical protein n=1 Tax=Methylocaldum sp. TaxID=1969727 RepID=UPI002D6C9C15|nr:hypothetical protein [Methylocaldum sp.]HYE38123.1 hypothetical protein [Methylocaldum sp.]
MITTIEFMGIQEAMALSPPRTGAMISIVDSAHNPAFTLSGWSEIKYFRFDDLVYLPLENPQYVLFDEQMAREIVDFVQDLHALEHPITLYVHCMAGVSRSGAVASWIGQEFGIPLPDYFLARAKPNPRVLSLLRQASESL